MGQTTTFHLPYPELADPADGPKGFRDLANATETALLSLAVVPIGALIDWPYASGSVPSWALLPYGQAISRTSYAALHALAQAAGYPHGSGDGSTTFALPDLRGRVLVGKDDMGGTAAGRITAAISGTAGTVLGAVVGAEGVTLTTAALPAHNHGLTGAISGAATGITGTGNAGAHAHSASADVQGWHSHGGATGAADRGLGHQHLVYSMRAGGGYGLSTANAGYKENVAVAWATGGVDISFNTPVGGGVDHLHGIGGDGSHGHNISVAGVGDHSHAISDPWHAHAHTLAIANAGGGGAHANVQPTLIVNKIMRVQ